ncbi:GNAT superfamily N-acetyltransferase [Kineosphaera limosa]|uniref:O-antigen ligase family protein n=1 Tax=Kineosphaera limosa TaxID=111564 RepID=UPI000A2F534D|nr:O-antigen ligase family protein [Kineosphaera limosa]NYE01964.1 GNAT superfamily N-acetyltransferase [Kineosphaera limosa]
MSRSRFPLTRALDLCAALVAAAIIVFVCLGGVVLLPLNRAGHLWTAQWTVVALGVFAVLTMPPRRWAAWAPWTFIAVWAVLFAWMPHALAVAPDARAADIELRRFVQCLIYSAALLACARGARLGLAGVRVGWLLALLTCGGIGLWEVLTANHLLFLDPVRGWVFGPRMPAATFLNPNNLAAMLIGMIAGAWALRSGLRWLWARVALDVVVVLGSVVVVFTQSRAGLLALAVVYALELWRRWPLWHAGHRERAAAGGGASSDGNGEPGPGHEREDGTETEAGDAGAAAKGPRWSRRWTLGAGGALAALAVASVTIPALARRNPVVEMVGMLFDDETARSDGLRLQLIRAALRYLRESGWTGSGAGSFEPLLWADPEPGVVKLTNLHNAFIELLSQYGLVVGATHALSLIALLAVAASPRYLPRDNRVEILGYLTAFFAFGIVASSSLTIPGWWLLQASAAASWWAAARERTPQPAESHALGRSSET